MQLQLGLGVGEGAVVAAGTAAVLGQVAAQAGLVPGPLVAPARPLPLPAAAPPTSRQLGEAHQPRHHGPRRAQPRHHQLPAVRSCWLLRGRSWGQLDAGEGVQLGAQSAQLAGVPRPLQRYDQLLHALAEALRGLQLVDDALHVRLVLGVPVQQAAPLVRRDPQPRLRGDLHYLGVVLTSQTLVRTELLLQLHQTAVPVPLGHLEAAGPVEELHHVPDAGLGGLGEVGLQLLHHVHHQHLVGAWLLSTREGGAVELPMNLRNFTITESNFMFRRLFSMMSYYYIVS